VFIPVKKMIKSTIGAHKIDNMILKSMNVEILLDSMDSLILQRIHKGKISKIDIFQNKNELFLQQLIIKCFCH
jgi:hypothetical protein